TWSHRSALPGMLLSAADCQWSDEEIAEASEVCGGYIADLLEGNDANSAAGRLGPSTDLYDAEPSIRSELLRPLRLVPKALLDADSRTMASIAFVDNRRAEKLGWLNANSRQILAEADRLFAILNDPKARAVVEARRHP